MKFSMTRRALALALLLAGCTDLRNPTASEPAMPGLSAAVISAGCGAGQLIQAINNANGLPIITRSMTINGNGAKITRAPLVPEFRFLYVLGGTANVTINDLTMSGGAASNSGGAVFNDRATLTLNRVKLLGNSAGDWGSGAANVAGTMIIRGGRISSNMSGDLGGGIVNVGGTLTIGSGTIVGNSSGDSGGGLTNDWGTVHISTSRISGNLAGDTGGGLSNQNTSVLTLETSTVSTNQAVEDGGGVYNVDATVTILRSTISGNVGRWGGGLGNESGGNGGVMVIRSSTIS